MTKSTISFVSIVLALVLNVSTFREELFRRSLSPYYSQSFLYELEMFQIQSRIEYMAKVSSNFNLTRGEISFANSSIETVKLIYNAMNKTSHPIDSQYNSTQQMLKAAERLFDEYKKVVLKFNEQFTRKYPTIPNIDDYTPSDLNNILIHGDDTISIKQKALMLVDVYSKEISFITSKVPTSEYARLDKIGLAELCLDNLNKLRDEITSIQFEYVLSKETLSICLQRFSLILQIIGGPKTDEMIRAQRLMNEFIG